MKFLFHAVVMLLMVGRDAWLYHLGYKTSNDDSGGKGKYVLTSLRLHVASGMTLVHRSGVGV